MSFTVLHIPNDPATWPTWLEGELMGLHLHELVSQLKLLTADRRDQPLNKLLSDNDLTQIAARGLTTLTQQQIGSLLANPTCLYRLQESILTSTGSYWPSVPVHSSHQSRSDAVLARLQQSVSNSSLTSFADERPNRTPDVSSSRRRALLPSVAAAVLIGVGIWLMQPSPPPSWGFAKSDVKNASVASSVEYFNLLADAGNDWFKKRPENTAQLRNRLQTFSQGCQVLIEAEHKPLSTAEREWLVKKCHAWKDKIDELIVSLDTAPENFPQIQTAADDVVNRLVTALKAGPA